MRFIHTADIHLGAEPDVGKPWCGERSKEIWRSFERLIERAEEEKIDLLLIAGDLFHRQPLLRELKELNYFFTLLSVTKVVIILGNHDYLKKDSYYHTFPFHENVVFLMEDILQSVYFPHINTEVYGFSYHERKIKQPLYDEIRPEYSNRRTILLAHGGDQEHIPINRQKLLRSGFDYIALGHIHKPQILNAHKIAYAGALEPLDIGDRGPHGYIEGEFHGKDIKIHFVPFAKREYKHIEIAVDKENTAAEVKHMAERSIKEMGIENIYKITLTGYKDVDTVFDLERLETLGNIAEAVDETEPEYDLDKLAHIYKGHIIGRYIERMKDSEKGSVQRKALYLGLKALLDGKREIRWK